MKRVFFWGLRFSIAVGIFFIIFTTVPFSEVMATIASVKPVYVIIAILISTVPIQYLSALRLKILISKHRISLNMWDIVKINFTTAFYGLFLPGYISEGGIRWYKLSKQDRKFLETFTSIIFGRLVYMLITTVLGALFFAIDIKPTSGQRISILLPVFASILIFVYLLFLNKRVLLLFGEGLGKPGLIPVAIHAKLNRFISSVRQYHDLPLTWHGYIIGVCLMENILIIISTYLFVLSLGLNLSIITIGWIRVLTTLIAMIPISISGLGVREAALIHILGFYGISPINATAFSLLLYSRIVFQGVIGGLLEAAGIPGQGRDEKKDINP